MPEPVPNLPNVPPTVVEAFDRFESDFAAVWLDYDIGGPWHWKLADIWRVYCRVQRRLGAPEYRCYYVRARKRERAIRAVLTRIAGIFPVTVTLYRASPPMTRPCITAIERFNARVARQ